MHASEHFKITRGPDDDWFDPILNADTQLFIDPFLIFKDVEEVWREAHAFLIGHFDQVFQLMAQANFNQQSLANKKALSLLLFKEPKELCLGYTSTGTSGAGSGQEFAGLIATAIEDAIRRGLHHPKHFEELGILNEGIGADRISDITCTILKQKLIAYTQEIAHRHNMPLEPHKLYASGFDDQRLRWTDDAVELPTNPASGGPLLFVPERFLRELPSLNADDWWSGWENEQLRTDLNYEVMGKVNKQLIVTTARAHPESLRSWIQAKEDSEADPYDLENDPLGVWGWSKAASAFAMAHPLQLTPPTNEVEFLQVIERVVDQFKLFIEEQGGWYLLWDQGRKDKPEHAVQLLFRGIAQNYCAANNISLDAEVNLGRGPVDFKFSTGVVFRAHLEVKKLHNGKFWNGLRFQLPSYMKSDGVKNGWFLSVRYRDGKQWDARQRELPLRVAEVAAERQITLWFKTVDARPADSASKL